MRLPVTLARDIYCTIKCQCVRVFASRCPVFTQLTDNANMDFWCCEAYFDFHHYPDRTGGFYEMRRLCH